MKHEHAMCRANDIKQKHLLGGNLAQKKKKTIRFAFFFPYLLFVTFYFIFVIFLYFFSFISILRTMVCLKCEVIERILVFFVVFSKNKRVLVLSFELSLVYENTSIMYEN
jgi:hypothetical protein